MRRCALVTGGSRGIGAAIVTQLLSVVDAVWFFDLQVPEKTDAHVYAYQCDITNREQVAAGVKAVADWCREHGYQLDVLVNNAGITRDGMAVRMSESQWKLPFDVNVHGAFWCSQQVLPLMLRQRSGYIVSISSVVGTFGNAGQANYAATKAAINGMTKSLAREYGSRGITVNAIAPGFIQTEMTDSLPQSLIDRAKEQISMKKLGVPEDVAYLVAFLVSGKADYITGQIIHCDGGM